VHVVHGALRAVDSGQWPVFALGEARSVEAGMDCAELVNGGSWWDEEDKGAGREGKDCGQGVTRSQCVGDVGMSKRPDNGLGVAAANVLAPSRDRSRRWLSCNMTHVI
jgi:hypothetical protein